MNESLRTGRDPGDILARLLDHYGLSQAKYAELLGVSRSAVNEVITGKKTLTINEWRRWAGALHMKIEFAFVPSGGSQGFFDSPEDLWDWVQKRAQRRRMDTPTRTEKDIRELAAQMGVLGDYSRLMPDHLAPVFDSGWLYSEGSMHTLDLAQEVLQRMNSHHRYDEALQKARADTLD